MFKCDKCGTTSAPRVSPTLVHKSQVKEYTFLDSEDNIKMSVGSEIVWEKKWCPSCSGKDVPLQVEDGAHTVNMRGARACFNHLQRCNKNAETCKVCKQVGLFLASLPLHHLSEALADTPVDPATFTLGTLILDSTFERGTHRSYRGLMDKAAGMQLLSYYEEELKGRIGSASR